MEYIMTRSKFAAPAIAACLSALIAATGVDAAEITIVSSLNVRPEMDAIIPAFERVSGHKVTIDYRTTPVWVKQIDDGTPIDLAIAYTDTLDHLIETGKVSAGLRVDILQSGIGVVVRAGAPKPDIGSIEALKNALLGAKSIAFSKGPTGVYLATVVARLGIKDQLKPKTILTDSGIGAVGTAVAKGEAEIGIHGTYELLSIADVDFVGPIPRELQKMMVYSAVVPANAKEPEAAKSLIRFLSSEIAIPLIHQKGMEPIAIRQSPN
jgi:molybdate transport system substrate-binding protein